MGYFSNGTEGEMYHEAYCSRCIHDVNEDCVVWLLHLLHNYDDCNNDESILHSLIPREGIHNLECTMFFPRDAGAAIRGQLTLADAGKATP